jgi:stage V sporulation protein G
MPSRKLCDHCPDCGEKNHLRARYCNSCGRRLDEDRSLRSCQARNGSHGTHASHGNGGPRLKLHADIAHPINAECRRRIAEQVIQAYWREVERSQQPGYVPPSLDGLDGDDYEPYDPGPGRAGVSGDRVFRAIPRILPDRNPRSSRTGPRSTISGTSYRQ